MGGAKVLLLESVFGGCKGAYDGHAGIFKRFKLDMES